jgi:hypothetical protein
MTAGFNIKARVWRVCFANSDDVVGGAVVTGTYVYCDVPARMHEKPVDHVFFQQGIEVVKTFQMMVKPSTLMIYDRDEVEITWPTDHRFYGKRFRVMGDAYTNFHPREERGYLILDLTRSVRAHANQ